MTSTSNSVNGGTFLQRHDFLIRRLHSLSGLVPVGAYMCVHLLTNSSLLTGVDVFQNAVYAIHSLPYLEVIEWSVIFLPILFHAVVGVWIARSGKSNVSQYGFAGNRRYTLQRITGYFAILFIFLHVFQLHGWFHADWWLKGVAEPLGMAKFDPYNAASSLGNAMQSLGVVWPIFYVLGVLACTYHLANGIWTAGITWGIWLTPNAQRRASYACVVFGILIGSAGLSAIGAATKVDPVAAKELEDKMYKVRSEGLLIKPNEHKRTDGRHHRDEQGPEPIIPQANATLP